MHKVESVPQNEICKLFWNFEIQTKLIGWILLFLRNSVKIKESEKTEKYLDFIGELKDYRT